VNEPRPQSVMPECLARRNMRDYVPGEQFTFGPADAPGRAAMRDYPGGLTVRRRPSVGRAIPAGERRRMEALLARRFPGRPIKVHWPA
jgi:hypothetical protein